MAKAIGTKSGSKELLIAIETFDQSYHIADHRAEIGRVDDEAIIDIHGTIVRAIDEAKALEGKRAEVSLICSKQYHCHRGHSESQQPMLMTANVLKGTFKALAYLPAKPFWALPKMITSGRVSHIIADYRAGPRRDSELRALYFASLDNTERRE
ncbi:hypothetical protein [Altererythrobacter sp. ZODW24]|uniref:hypothetical protein n=1 Tax=Altererythrobacter sp. ZODW24 TaxID=2185142 RepID=UPI0013B425ED|nr:hypothetical protein [Altererythrobacter sp. ZODW24]